MTMNNCHIKFIQHIFALLYIKSFVIIDYSKITHYNIDQLIGNYCKLKVTIMDHHILASLDPLSCSRILIGHIVLKLVSIFQFVNFDIIGKKKKIELKGLW